MAPRDFPITIRIAWWYMPVMKGLLALLRLLVRCRLLSATWSIDLAVDTATWLLHRAVSWR